MCWPRSLIPRAEKVSLSKPGSRENWCTPAWNENAYRCSDFALDRVAVVGTSCRCGRTGFKLRCIGRTDDMLILLGVNVFPSAVKDVVSSFHPRTTGEIQIVLHEPGPKVAPPLNVVAEYADTGSDLAALKREIEGKIKATLTITAPLDLVPAGTLPRYQMKGQLIRKNYD